jgi:hypothetical protein
MLTPTGRLCPNDAEVAAKVMDGEAIIINLSNGMYYSMDEVGGLIWEMIAEGHSLQDIVSTIPRRYDVEPDRARGDVERLAGELLRENLVLVSDREEATPAIPPPDRRERLPYATPELQKYRDMGDLLALDPPMPAPREFPWRAPSREPSA